MKCHASFDRRRGHPLIVGMLLRSFATRPCAAFSQAYPPLLACPKPFEKPFLFLEFNR
jgi:hypothetical protein